MLKTVDNFQGDADRGYTKPAIQKKSGEVGYHSYLSSRKSIKPIHVTLGEYKARSANHVLYDLFSGRDKNSDDDLIISLSQKADGTFSVQAGNYVGKFAWEGLEVDIRSRFSESFMKRMLNVANDVFLDDVSAFDASASKNLDFSKLIIYYMFVLKLEKAFLLGLPKAYRSIQHHEMTLKGKIDINRFIKRDIPFQGKISSVSREQQEIQDIVDVLHKAVSVIDKQAQKSENDFTKNIAHIKTHLKQQRSNRYVSPIMIQKAMSSSALQNPIFAPYKSVLEYAKLIIDASNLEEKVTGKEDTFGFLVNVAELFELYVTKLLQRAFPDWSVSSPEIAVCKDQFYQRKIIPDIVMQHRESNHMMVFDTKYKRMLMRGTKENVWDVDRCDFFQINTYMTYYQQQGFDLLAGGLLYPMESKYDEGKCYADNWFGNSGVQFVVDGIDLSESKDSTDKKEAMPNIYEREQAFMERVKSYVSKM